MTDSHNLHVEVQGGDIIVTLPGTGYRISYGRVGGRARLAAFDYVMDSEADTAPSVFLTRSLKAANDKARELGWLK
jgi:hypothetical protein